MNSTHYILFGILICLTLVNARHHGERIAEESEQDEYSINNDDIVQKQRHNAANTLRHRRKRWQTNYGYNYPPPSQPFYSEHDRRDDRQDYLTQIVRLLDEISVYVKRPPPPPQPLYVPYPVYVPVPQNCNCPSVSTPPNVPTTVNITKRLPAMDDINRNWGIVDNDDIKPATSEDDYDDDGSRPISFTPVKPPRPLLKQPKVDHGSAQAAGFTQQPPRNVVEGSTESPLGLGICDAAILSCCKPTATRQELLDCFTNVGCQKKFAGGRACQPQSISAVIDAFSRAYSPVKN